MNHGGADDTEKTRREKSFKSLIFSVSSVTPWLVPP